MQKKDPFLAKRSSFYMLPQNAVNTNEVQYYASRLSPKLPGEKNQVVIET